MQRILSRIGTFCSSILKTVLAAVGLICLMAVPAPLQAQQCSLLFQTETRTPIALLPTANIPIQKGWNRKNLRVITFNAQDFTLYEKPNSKLERPDPKNERLVRAAAKTLFETQPDIIVIQEVGNKYSLQKLAEMSTHGEYDVVFIQGNDAPKPGTAERRHARHIGFLIKKSLDLQYTVTANLKIPYKGHEPYRSFIFDRGLPVLKFFDAANPKNPLFAVIGIHNHSTGEQGRFIELKNLEEQAMLEVIKDLQNSYGENFPIMAMGDLNLAVNDPNRLAQFKDKMVESFDALRVGVTDQARITQVYKIMDQPVARQVDGVFISRILANRIKSALTLIFPTNGISDHRPLMVDINLEGAVP